jgi:hypothetical protein
MIWKKHALGLNPMGGRRFSEKVMLKEKARAGCPVKPYSIPL